MNKYILSALCMLMLTGCLDSKGYNTASTNTTTVSHTITDLKAIPHDEAIVITFDYERHNAAHEVVFTIEVAKASFIDIADITTSQTALPDVTTLTTHANRTTITGLTNGTTYYVRVRAMEDDHAPSLWSNEVQATPTPPTAPVPSLTVTADKQAIWVEISPEADTTHTLYYSSASFTTTDDLAGYPLASHSTVVRGLADGTTYYVMLLPSRIRRGI